MERLEKLKRKIDKIIEEIPIEEIIDRIEQDKSENEDIELIYYKELYSDELEYKKLSNNLNEVKEEVSIWNQETLGLAA